MAKVCMVCQDGISHPDSQGMCPKCGNFLKTVKNESYTPTNDFEEDYSDVFLDFDPKVNPSPIPDKSHYETDRYEDKNDNRRVEPREKVPQKKKPRVEKSSSLTVIEGQVQNFHADTQPKKLFERWMTSFISGIPFANDGCENTFQVYEEGNQRAHEVILYGRITRGRLNKDDYVRVAGKRDRYNSIIAHSIENTSTGTNVSVENALSANAVRVITYAGIFLIIALLIFLVTFDWVNFLNLLVAGIMNIILQVVMIFLPLIIVVFALWFMLKKLFRK